MNKWKLTRRQFLKAGGYSAVLLATTALGYKVFDDLNGEPPPHLSPYIDLQESQSASASDQARHQILIALNASSSNPFGSYLAEILAAEGLKNVVLREVASLSQADLDYCDILLLAEGVLNKEIMRLIDTFVLQGGCLIAMRPVGELAELVGVKPTGGILKDGYLRIAPEHLAARGIYPGELQFHGEADIYELDGGEVVAWMVDKPASLTPYPAVVLHRRGEGWVCLWAYDLARSVLFTRQGNPILANQEMDNFYLIRPSDMFVNWLDLDRIHIQQADEQQRLLINILTFQSQTKVPILRFWYFPKRAKTVLIATADCHQNPTYAIQAEMEIIERYGGRMTIYNLPPIYPLQRLFAQKIRWLAADLKLMGEAYLPSPRQIKRWREHGHEFALHPVVETGLETGWEMYWKAHNAMGYGPVSPTVRTHCILWTGWVETARVQASYGIRMNTDYYHVGTLFRNQAQDWVYGYFTGSGLPMRFMDETGKLLNIYQQATQLSDDHLLNLHWGGQVKLPCSQAIEVSKQLLKNSLTGGYAAICGNFHVDPYAEDEKYSHEAAHWLEGTLEFTAENDIPIWDTASWLYFNESRRSVELIAVHWDASDGRAVFKLRSMENCCSDLTLLFPKQHAGLDLRAVIIDDTEVTFEETLIIGSIMYYPISLPSSARTIELLFA